MLTTVFFASLAIAIASVPNSPQNTPALIERYDPCKGQISNYARENEAEWRKRLVEIYSIDKKLPVDTFEALLNYHASLARTSENWRLMEEDVCVRQKQ